MSTAQRPPSSPENSRKRSNSTEADAVAKRARQDDDDDDDDDEWARFQREMHGEKDGDDDADEDETRFDGLEEAEAAQDADLEQEYISAGVVIQAAASTAPDPKATAEPEPDAKKRHGKGVADRDAVIEQDEYDNIYKELAVQEEMYGRVDRLRALREDAKSKARGKDAKQEAQDHVPPDPTDTDSDDDDDADDDDQFWRKRGL